MSNTTILTTGIRLKSTHVNPRGKLKVYDILYRSALVLGEKIKAWAVI
jgi:hypothetical protein